MRSKPEFRWLAGCGADADQAVAALVYIELGIDQRRLSFVDRLDKESGGPDGDRAWFKRPLVWRVDAAGVQQPGGCVSRQDGAALFGSLVQSAPHLGAVKQ